MKEVEKITKRVGKTEIQSESIIQKLQELMPEKKIQCAISCRGTDRTVGPPTKIVSREAPFRKMVFIHRHNGTIMSDPEWEYWQNLAQRQLVRPGHPVRLGITVFACNPLNEIQPSSSLTDQMSPLQAPPDDALPNPKIQPDVESPESELAKCDNQSVQHGPRFLQLSKEEQSFALKVHRNMGHPTPDRLSWLLKQQGFRPDAVQSPHDLRCSACESLKVPKISRPSHVMDPMDFNDRIAIDGLTYTSKSGTKYHMYHLIDYATSYHVACPAPNRRSASAIQFIGQQWVSWAGSPVGMIVDAATEFNSREMEEQLFVLKPTGRTAAVNVTVRFWRRCWKSMNVNFPSTLTKIFSKLSGFVVKGRMHRVSEEDALPKFLCLANPLVFQDQ